MKSISVVRFAMSEQPFTQEHIAELRDQAFGEKNDRGACLLFSANLENALDAVLQAGAALLQGITSFCEPIAQSRFHRTQTVNANYFCVVGHHNNRAWRRERSIDLTTMSCARRTSQRLFGRNSYLRSSASKDLCVTGSIFPMHCVWAF
jgi:hypothetical protein